MKTSTVLWCLSPRLCNLSLLKYPDTPLVCFQAARQPSGQHESAEASASAQPAPPETTAVASPIKSKAGSSSGSNDEAESVVARSNASDDSEEEEGEIRGKGYNTLCSVVHRQLLTCKSGMTLSCQTVIM